MRRLSLLSVLLLLFIQGFSSNFKLPATRIDEKITIDGILDENSWQISASAENFSTFSPSFGDQPLHDSEVKVLYDNKALYIGATLYDSDPEKILKEFTQRDNDNGNADMFVVSLSPNNDGLNMYEFKVSASNVQTDVRQSNNSNDYNWNAVWTSATKITNNGWVVEIKIPYSAIRFPKGDIQNWSINFWRKIRRTRELSSWHPVDQSKGNSTQQMGSLTNLKNINPPLRLALYPYLSSNISHNSHKNSSMYGFSGGLDLKLGISKSHTLDMTLIPDFSQVKSDQEILNLSPFETYYSENRPFFTEGTDLFNKCELFYSRRIGKLPEGYNNVEDLRTQSYTIKSNPRHARLVNALKISGRGDNNLAIGFLNAVTANTYAEVENPEGEIEKIKTEPWANYNILVVDKSLKNGSYINITNARLDRPDSKYQSNTLGTSFRFMDKSNRYGIESTSAWSNIKDTIIDKPNNGFKFKSYIGKLNGNWQYNYHLNLISDDYSQNDLGFLRENNFVSHSIFTTYNKFEKFWKLNRFKQIGEVGYKYRYNDQRFREAWLWFHTFLITKNFTSVWANINFRSPEFHDYYETRNPDRVYIRKGFQQIDAYMSTDYRKTFAIDFKCGAKTNTDKNHGLYGLISPRVRVNDKLTLRYKLDYDFEVNGQGYVTTKQNDIIFGTRDIQTLTHSVSGSWVFNNKMDLSLSVRHYWRKVNYNSFHLLNTSGHLNLEPFNLNEDHDINFNAFNIDLMYSWNFAPGSFLSFVWKNNIINSEIIPENAQFPRVLENYNTLFNDAINNSISLKILYYLDWQYFK